MLGSITPLGERGRGSRWWLTVSAYVTGSTVAGAATGAAFGLVGALTVEALGLSMSSRLGILAVVTAVGLLLDLHVAGLALPTVHRQVDEDWRTRYRGWFWGLGFGLQLGTGVVTIVTTSTIYATWAAALLTGSPALGAAVGAVFGLARSLPVLSVARVRRTDQLFAAEGRMRRLARPAQRATLAAGSALAGLSAVGALRW
jgi:hypothetical protein